jgi:hypothetical protein
MPASAPRHFLVRRRRTAPTDADRVYDDAVGHIPAGRRVSVVKDERRRCDTE